jgi:hypothetical protein
MDAHGDDANAGFAAGAHRPVLTGYDRLSPVRTAASGCNQASRVGYPSYVSSTSRCGIAHVALREVARDLHRTALARAQNRADVGLELADVAWAALAKRVVLASWLRHSAALRSGL